MDLSESARAAIRDDRRYATLSRPSKATVVLAQPVTCLARFIETDLSFCTSPLLLAARITNENVSSLGAVRPLARMFGQNQEPRK